MEYHADKLDLIKDEKYPLSAKYDSEWIVENQMGSQCLWLMEALAGEMELKPGMRVLDLGCGKAISSIFLAREFGVQVWATDLWISASDNWKRICEAGVEQQVFPIHAEARDLPYADAFFDAVVSINSVQFYGTDDLYFKDHLVKLVKPGGQIGMIVPGLYSEFTGPVPDHIRSFWKADYFNWHSPGWWRWHWEKTGCAEVELADTLPEKEGYRLFRRFGEVMNPSDSLIAADEGRNISFVRVIARRKLT